MDDLTFKFTDSGIVLNTDPITPETPFIDVMRVEGLSNSPYRTTERDREGQDGGFVDAEYEKMRTIVIDAIVYCPSDSIEVFLEELKENYAPSRAPYPFYFQPPGTSERVVFCKSYGVKYDWATSRRIGVVEIQIILAAEDPTIYDSAPVTGRATLPTSASGRAYGRTYPMTYGYTGLNGADYSDLYLDGYNVLVSEDVNSASGIVNIFNGGNKNTGATITFFGPIVNPAVVHDRSGRTLLFDIELQSDQFLVVDLRSRTVLLNGTTSRRNTMDSSSRWFMLPPGGNSLRLLGSDSVSGLPDPAMTVETRGAYR